MATYDTNGNPIDIGDALWGTATRKQGELQDNLKHLYTSWEDKAAKDADFWRRVASYGGSVPQTTQTQYNSGATPVGDPLPPAPAAGSGVQYNPGSTGSTQTWNSGSFGGYSPTYQASIEGTQSSGGYGAQYTPGGLTSTAGTTSGTFTKNADGSFAWVNPSQYNAATGSAALRDAAAMGVTDQMLVENRLAGILQSPVGKIAKDIAIQFQNSRGMMDSSQAQQAIVQASIQAGLPIAEADAAKYFTAAQENLAAENAARSENQAAQNTMTSLNMNALNAAAANNAVAQNQALQQNQSLYMTQLSQNQQLAQAQYQWDTDLQFKKDQFKWDESAQQQELNLKQLQVMQAQATNDAEIATNKMAFVQSVAAAGMDADSVSRVLWAAYGVGLITEAEVHSVFEQMQSPIETTV